MGEQLDLFQDGTYTVTAARIALRGFELDRAIEILEELCRRAPGSDAEAAALLATTRSLFEQRARGRNGELAALGGVPALELRAVPDALVGWSVRVAELLDAEHAGAAAPELGLSEPAGYYWLQVKKLDRAQRSLAQLLSGDSSNARARGYLADVLYELGHHDRAFAEYVRAYLTAPADVSASVRAPEIAELLVLAREDMELPAPSGQWVPVLAVLERLRPPPHAELVPVHPVASAPAHSELPGLQFFELMARERSARDLDSRVELRRKLKRLEPALFARYLERFA